MDDDSPYQVVYKKYENIWKIMRDDLQIPVPPPPRRRKSNRKKPKKKQPVTQPVTKKKPPIKKRRRKMEEEKEYVIVISENGNNGHNYHKGEIGYITTKDPNGRAVYMCVERSHDANRIGFKGNWLILDVDYEPHVIEAPKLKLKLTFDNVILPPDLLTAVMETLSQTKADIMDKIFEKWGLLQTLEKGRGMTMLFYGPPGTGKTLLAEVIASHLDKKLRMVDSGTIQTSECGGTERNIKKVFTEAKKKGDVVLFDECDSLIYDRSRIGMILAAEVNCLLSEIERFDGVCIFTTNNTPCLDAAFERRVSLKLEFPFPDKAARKAIWLRMFPYPEATFAACVCFETLSKYRISGGHIKNIALNAARRAAHMEKDLIEMEDFMVCLEREAASHKVFQAKNDCHQDGGEWNVKGGPTGVDKVMGMA